MRSASKLTGRGCEIEALWGNEVHTLEIVAEEEAK